MTTASSFSGCGFIFVSIMIKSYFNINTLNIIIDRPNLISLFIKKYDYYHIKVIKRHLILQGIKKYICYGNNYYGRMYQL